MISKKDINYFYESSFRELYYVWGAKRHLGFHYGFYDSFHKTHDEAILNMNRVIAGKARIGPEMKVLDAGCGIGGSVIWLAKTIGAQVIGITISEKQAIIAKNLAEKFGVGSRTDFFVQDYTHTNFPDGSFDVVWALESMSYAFNKLDFVSEAYRILKPGGVLVIADAFLTRNKYTAAEKEIMEKTFTGWAVPSVAQLPEFVNHLNHVGFKSIKHDDISKNVAPSSKKFYKLGLMALPFVKILTFFKIISPKILERVRAGILQWRLLRQELWSYLILTAEK